MGENRHRNFGLWVLAATYMLLIVAMAKGTFVEAAMGNAMARTRVYGTGWFCALWALLALLSLWQLVAKRLWRRWRLLLLHLSFLFILSGAALTHFFATEGRLHLRQDAEAANFLEAKTLREVPMPFTLRLDSFRVVHYEGTATPADFVSYTDKGQISMNHPLRIGAYRFFQSSFDADGQGTILQVSHDPWGRSVTLAAYALLFLSALLLLLPSRRRAPSREKEREANAKGGGAMLKAMMLLLLMSFSYPSGTAARSVPSVNREKAALAARKPVDYNGRIAPFNTLARDFLQKVYGRTSYRGLTAEQVVLGWQARPDVWKDEKMIRVKDARLRRALGAEGDYVSIAQLFDADGNYRLDAMPATEKAVRELDERVGLILMLVNGTLVKPAPAGTQVNETRFAAELLYNRIPFTRIGFMALLLLGFAVMLTVLFSSNDTQKPSRAYRFLLYARVLTACVGLFLLMGYALRWYVGGRIPLSNGSETMQFLALPALLYALYTGLRQPVGFASALLVAGFALLVSYLGERSPQITSLVPVLNSPLLSLHVGVVMVSYALFGVLAFSGFIALCRPSMREALARQSLRLLRPAALLLAAGIFLGAIWADLSWGRYWGWDPKEVWALITLMLYAVPLHGGSLRSLRRPLVLHAYLLFAFLAVLMTYFGVNHFLGGLHSYA